MVRDGTGCVGVDAGEEEGCRWGKGTTSSARSTSTTPPLPVPHCLCLSLPLPPVFLLSTPPHPAPHNGHTLKYHKDSTPTPRSPPPLNETLHTPHLREKDDEATGRNINPFFGDGRRCENRGDAGSRRLSKAEECIAVGTGRGNVGRVVGGLCG